MFDNSAGKVTLQSPRPALRRDEYKMVKAGQGIIACDYDFEDISIELEMSIIRRDLQFIRYEILLIYEINPLSKSLTDCKLRYKTFSQAR